MLGRVISSVCVCVCVRARARMRVIEHWNGYHEIYKLVSWNLYFIYVVEYTKLEDLHFDHPVTPDSFR